MPLADKLGMTIAAAREIYAVFWLVLTMRNGLFRK